MCAKHRVVKTCCRSGDALAPQAVHICLVVAIGANHFADPVPVLPRRCEARVISIFVQKPAFSRENHFSPRRLGRRLAWQSSVIAKSMICRGSHHESANSCPRNEITPRRTFREHRADHHVHAH